VTLEAGDRAALREMVLAELRGGDLAVLVRQLQGAVLAVGGGGYRVQWGVTRAGREQVFLGSDTDRAKVAQATASGWDPGARPSNEFGGATPHKVIVRGNTAYIVDPSGKVISTRPARGR
jgi:hypothetical protein